MEQLVEDIGEHIVNVICNKKSDKNLIERLVCKEPYCIHMEPHEETILCEEWFCANYGVPGVTVKCIPVEE